MTLYAVGREVHCALSGLDVIEFLDFMDGEYRRFDGRVMTQLTSDKALAERWLDESNRTCKIHTFDLTSSDK